VNYDISCRLLALFSG